MPTLVFTLPFVHQFSYQRPAKSLWSNFPRVCKSIIIYYYRYMSPTINMRNHFREVTSNLFVRIVISKPVASPTSKASCIFGHLKKMMELLSRNCTKIDWPKVPANSMNLNESSLSGKTSSILSLFVNKTKWFPIVLSIRKTLQQCAIEGSMSRSTNSYWIPALPAPIFQSILMICDFSFIIVWIFRLLRNTDCCVKNISPTDKLIEKFIKLPWKKMCLTCFWTAQLRRNRDREVSLYSWYFHVFHYFIW